MTQFKQIIGRGTRINEDFDKYFFTIMDFKKATELFSGRDFDGDPVQIYEPNPDDPIVPPDDDFGNTDGTPDDDGGVLVDPPVDEPDTGGRVKYVIHDVEVMVVAERVQYYGKGGKLITESLRDYTRKTIRRDYASLDHFLKQWNKAERKKAIIEELEEAGVLFEPLADVVGKDYGIFDLICHVAYDQPPLTRKERAENVKKRNYFTKYEEKARNVLNALLDTWPLIKPVIRLKTV